MMSTLLDIKQKTKLSRETILEAMITPSALPVKVVKLVLETLQTMQYRKLFKNMESIPLMIIVPDATSYAFLQLFTGIEKMLSVLGVRIVPTIVVTRFLGKRTNNILRKLLQENSVQAVICVNIRLDPKIRELFRRRGKVCVSVGTATSDALSVSLAHDKGISLGVEYLLRTGYKRIGLITLHGDLNQFDDVLSQRFLIYRRILEREGIKYDKNLVYETSFFDGLGGYKSLEYFSRLSERPDAVFCLAGNTTAIGLVNAIKKSGLKTPDDIAILGYGDFAVAEFMEPALSTIRQRSQVAGAAALILALEALVGIQNENITIVPELVVRETT
ncbi:LacI family transcriptional regulator [Treponema phagedenis]|uniref:LacI family transcriptional regulator n=1 Tax=Treponema phagedenis TaxID=162 RepID=A0A0B7GY34_TREPH|nr:substrate-binding domain-containing protein [Treponema phagedenis]NVP23083.1 substrate-binding domain-containing protein [Treponema phagedenis]QEJ98116.1 LacI family transcriptional regulator [Treponema phagedenis]QEK00957.1 LacI family transcriptional regulator [Treponema phagedenis]QEK03624.1 LacI family transcriptional regulator [Treponema phagedenis]QEK05966.1 LacI family transcriptional regulator [Treponema phagedenis]